MQAGSDLSGGLGRLLRPSRREEPNLRNLPFGYEVNNGSRKGSPLHALNELAINDIASTDYARSYSALNFWGLLEEFREPLLDFLTTLIHD